MPQEHKRLMFEESFVTLTDALERFVDAKTKRITKFINYFQIMKQCISEESKKLEGFEKDWDKTKRELRDFNLDSFLNTPRTDSFDKTNQFRKCEKNKNYFRN
ncbi:MAG: hypothetical protein J4F36_12945 [Nitrosopumilaceae archaeon]|nr:hypothetical protein [Nitrosopumilaceae archaeon]